MSEEPTDKKLDDELTEIEVQAIDRGWAPENQWEGDPNQWVDAPTFIRQGELMDRISSQTKQLKSQSSEINDLKTAMQSLAETNKKIAEKEYEKAMKDLKKQKVNALENEDHTSVIEIDEQLSELKDAKKQLEEDIQITSPVHPDVVEWINNNNWYESDIVLRGAADSLTADYIDKNPSAQNNPKMALDYVEEQIKKEFPHKFGVRKRPSATVDDEGSEPRSKISGKNKYTKRHLTPEQKKIAETIVNTGVMSMQEYVNQLADLGEIEG